MKEILVWGDPEKEFQRLNIDPFQAYSFFGWNIGDNMYVYEINDEEWDVLCHDEKIYELKFGWSSKEDEEKYKLEIEKYPEDAWDSCAWRYCEGSNMGFVNRRYNINGHYINAWDGVFREQYGNTRPRKFKHLLEYFCDEIGASTEKNITALAVDLARQNNMSMADLFEKYQKKYF